MPRCRTHLVQFLVTVLLSACGGGAAVIDQAPAKGKQPLEYLDEQSGATVTAVEKPLLFARERSERAANLRDYVTLMAVTVNRGGKRDSLLIAYIWSTLDARYEPAGRSPTAWFWWLMIDSFGWKAVAGRPLISALFGP